jgi:hypothetical protein
MAEQGIQRAEQQLAAAKDRLLGADTDVQSLRKQLAAVKVGRGHGTAWLLLLWGFVDSWHASLRSSMARAGPGAGAHCAACMACLC